jgi:1-acyl-sn-glycerol-3-phosphate acyltransferase
MKAWVKLGLKVFFRKIEVRGQENIPLDQAVIFTPNHQNAFLDALLTEVYCPRFPYALARGDIFKAAWAERLLHMLRIWPVYRVRDGIQEVGKNNSVFQIVSRILRKKGCLLMFPEGAHHMGHCLLPVKKGFARIAMQAEVGEEFQLNLQIVPVSLHYELHPEADQRVFLQFGPPLAVKDFQQQHETHPQHAFQALRKALHARMQDQMIDLGPQEPNGRLEKIWKVVRLFDQDHAASPAEMYEQDQALARKIQAAELTELVEKWEQAESQLGLGEREAHLLLYPLRKPLGWWLLSALPTAYGWLNHWPLRASIGSVLSKIEDQTFWASLKVGMGLVLTPIFYLLQILLFAWLSDSWGWAALYGLSLPLSGMLCIRSFQRWRDLRSSWRMVRVRRQKPEAWKAWETALRSLKDRLNA